MVENIILAQVLMWGYTRKRTSPKCTLKIDLRKAYYTISWEFLQYVLLALNFLKKLIRWVMACVTTPSFSLRVNGENFGFLESPRELRQGDPLCPFLFMICMKYLLRSLRKTTS